MSRIWFVLVAFLLLPGVSLAYPITTFNTDYFGINDHDSELEIRNESPGTSQSEFGLFFVDDINNPLNPQHFKIFDTTDNTGSIRYIEFDSSSRRFTLLEVDKTTVVREISPVNNAFGFYFISDKEPGTPYYTDSILNGGVERIFTTIYPDSVRVYTEDDENLTSAIIDPYRDMVVSMDDVNPVPEPGTLLLLGSGIAGLVAAKRRKKA